MDTSSALPRMRPPRCWLSRHPGLRLPAWMGSRPWEWDWEQIFREYDYVPALKDRIE